ncbi:MAG: methylmalonyl-CoA epimerase [Gemmatimonadetes bacterium]|nr:methylmalonyl-CoA epimerase [Gemmatimonadota bacterium]NNL30407.1 methylmalonyl-CoA epimerase [Gemmatimonadota bacterium]
MYSPSADRALHHVAVAVHSIAESRALYELLTGERCSPPETLDSQGVKVAFVGQVELLEPLSVDTTVGRFLARRGPGLHHVAFEVDDIAAELERLEGEGLRLIDREPRKGAKGHLVAFLHPTSTDGVLVELVQHTDQRDQRGVSERP